MSQDELVRRIGGRSFSKVFYFLGTTIAPWWEMNRLKTLLGARSVSVKRSHARNGCNMLVVIHPNMATLPFMVRLEADQQVCQLYQAGGTYEPYVEFWKPEPAEAEVSS